MHNLSAGGKTMSKNIIKEELQTISELIRKADELINPDQSIGYLLKKDMRDRLYGMKPACFMRLKPIGRDTSAYLFPICNRYGMEDPKVIKIAIKMAERLTVDGRFDPNDIKTMLGRLQHRNDRFIQTIPKPVSAATRKAKVTRMFNTIKQYLTLSKTGETA
jgi:hypothetical protein